MTPKEKAKQIFDKMILDWGCNECHNHWAKECSLIAVEEIIEGIERAFDEYEKATGNYVKNRIFYWDFYSDVKLEIEKL
jgi:hypothetical protein